MLSGIFTVARLATFLTRYGHIIAIGLAVAFAAWWLYDTGVERERARWEAEQAEKVAVLQSGLAEAQTEAAALRAETEALKRDRDKIVEDFQNALDNRPDQCLRPDELQSLRDTLNRLARPAPRP